MHSNTIFGFLVLAFFVHITASGKLPRYMGFFVGPVRVVAATAAPSTAGSGGATSSVAFPGLAPGTQTLATGFASFGNALSETKKWLGF